MLLPLFNLTFDLLSLRDFSMIYKSSYHYRRVRNSLLSHDVTVEKVEVDQSFCDMITTVREELSSGKRIEDQRLYEMMNNLAAIR